MSDTVTQAFDHHLDTSRPESSHKGSSVLNLLEISRHFGTGVLEGIAEPFKGAAQIATGASLSYVDLEEHPAEKRSAVAQGAEHLGQFAGQAFDFLIATKLGKGAIGAAEEKFGFSVAEKIGTRGAAWADRGASIGAGAITGFLEPTQNGGLDFNRRAKTAFLGATSVGLFEGSSKVLSMNGLHGNIFKETAKVGAASFLAGAVGTEIQSRVNTGENASLKDAVSAGGMWAVTGAALHVGGLKLTERMGESSAVANSVSTASSESTESAPVKIPVTELALADEVHLPDLKIETRSHRIITAAETTNLLVDMPAEMAKLGAEAATHKIRNDDYTQAEKIRTL